MTGEVYNEHDIKLTWQDNSDNEEGFIIERAYNSSFTVNRVQSLVAKNNTVYIDSTAEEDHSYYYRIISYNEKGNSEPSDVIHIQATKMPDPPTGLTLVSATADEIKIKWTDASGNEDGFYVERAENNAFTESLRKFRVDANTTSSAYYVDTNFKTNHYYYYRVRAYKESYYTDYSEYVRVAVASLEKAPSDFDYQVINDNGVRWVALNWNDNGTNELGFRIDRAKNESFTRELRSFYILPDICSFIDKTALAYTEYYYRIVAYNPSGDSEAEIIHVKTMEEPGQPTGLKVTGMEQGEVILGWEDNSKNESGFRIERSTTADFSGDIFRFSTDCDTSLLHDEHVQYGIIYYYRVSAYNMGGTSNYSNEISVKIPAQPQAPSVLRAETDDTGKVLLNWKDNAVNESGYRIERALDRRFTTKIKSYHVGPDVTNFVDTPETKDGYFYYQVYAYITGIEYSVAIDSRASNIAYAQLSENEKTSPSWVESTVRFNEISRLDLANVVDGNGYLTEDVECQDLNGIPNIAIGQGTIAIDIYGKPVTRIEIEPVDTSMIDLTNNRLVGIPVVMTPFGDSGPPLSVTLEHGASIVSYLFSLEPSGAVFDPPLKLTLEYEPSLIPQGSEPEDIIIAYYDKTNGTWIEIESEVDTRTNTVTADVSHFSVYGVLIKGAPAIQLWIVGLMIAVETVLGFGIMVLIKFLRRRHPVSVGVYGDES